MKDRLPRGIEWLLRIGLPADQREPIAGDLAEEYSARRRDDGSMRATAALWWQAAWLAWVFRWERTVRGRELPPIDDEIRRRAVVWESVWQDIAFGIRMLRRQPASFATSAFNRDVLSRAYSQKPGAESLCVLCALCALVVYETIRIDTTKTVVDNTGP